MVRTEVVKRLGLTAEQSEAVKRQLKDLIGDAIIRVSSQKDPQSSRQMRLKL